MLWSEIAGAVAEAKRTEPRQSTLRYAQRFTALLNPLTSQLTAEQVVVALTDGIIAGCTDDALYPMTVNEDDNAAIVTALVATAIAVSRHR